MTTELSTRSNVTLSSLLSGNVDLIYTIPLLLVSLVLTFAGTFLTLDRTRSFASKYGDQESAKSVLSSSMQSKIFSWWVFGGGVGGLCGGWAFATHSVTFFSLIIANQTNAAPLSTAEFLVVYILSSILCAALAGRFKLIALVLIGLTGGVGFSMILSVVIHPALITRQIFVALLAPITGVMASLPINRTQHGALRFASASCGSFGIVVSITLLAHDSSWQNIWDRLWLPSGDDWGTKAERGFSALTCLLLALGTLSDWYLYRRFGENPDEKWNTYLSEYSKSVSNASDRAGVFEGSKNWWQRIFRRGNVSKRPTQSDDPPESSALHLKNRDKEGRSKRFKVQFRPLGDYSDSASDSESESDKKIALSTPEMVSLPPRPWLRSPSPTSLALSDPTLYDSDDELDQLSSFKKKAIDFEYDSDTQDITNITPTSLSRAPHRSEPGWKPGFFLKQVSTPAPPPVIGAVPMTPSLLRAIDRIKSAQLEAYPSARSISSPTLSMSPPRQMSQKPDEKWQILWENVRHRSLQA